MPNHLHLLLDATDPERERTRLAHVLGSVFRGEGRGTWKPMPPPERITQGLHLWRQIRYVHLNPCRAELVKDPLEWPWSTHRGVVGAEVDPWVSARDLAAALGEQTHGFRERLHAYVSGDPSVQVAGTPFPTLAPARRIAAVPLDVVRRAALAATPWSRGSERLRAIVVLAQHQGWFDANVVAEACGVTPQAVRHLRRGGEPTAPALLCLGDARLQLGARSLRLRLRAKPILPFGSPREPNALIG